MVINKIKGDKRTMKELEIKISNKFMNDCKCLTGKEKDLFIEFIRYCERKEMLDDEIRLAEDIINWIKINSPSSLEVWYCKPKDLIDWINQERLSKLKERRTKL